MNAKAGVRRAALVAAGLVGAGGIVFITLRAVSSRSPGQALSRPPASARAPSSPQPSHAAAIAHGGPTLTAEEAASLPPAEAAIRLGDWPDGEPSTLPRVVEALAARGPDVVPAVGVALATATTAAGRGALADVLARIGTPEAVQELCTAAALAEPGAPRSTMAAAFRALGDPRHVVQLASLFSQTDDPVLVREASAAILRVADAETVLAIGELAREDGRLHSQRGHLVQIVREMRNPAARDGLETLARDDGDAEMAAAAAAALTAISAP